jgi:hypothetical protein
VLDAARPVLGAPATLTELGAALAVRWPDVPPASLAYAARFLAPIVQVPPRGLWQRTGRARWQSLEAWLPEAGTSSSPTRIVDDLVLRYLGAFGPATAADIATWSWLTGIAEVLERLRPRLRTFRDEAGRALFDLPDAPLPHPDTPAPVRFLPEYDNVSLSHADRSRIVGPAALGRVTGWVGTYLADGFVAGQWRADIDRRRGSATLVLEPFVPLTPQATDDAFLEGTSLVAFLAPGTSTTEVTFGVARAASVDRRAGVAAAIDGA